MENFVVLVEKLRVLPKTCNKSYYARTKPVLVSTPFSPTLIWYGYHNGYPRSLGYPRQFFYPIPDIHVHPRIPLESVEPRISLSHYPC